MRTLPVLALVAALASTSVSASTEAETEVCRDYADLARVVMQNHQVGVPRQALLDDINEGTPYVQLLANMLVEIAYQKPRYEHPEDQLLFIELFEANTYARCMSHGTGE